jgi:hypothetical protein
MLARVGHDCNLFIHSFNLPAMITSMSSSRMAPVSNILHAACHVQNCSSVWCMLFAMPCFPLSAFKLGWRRRQVPTVDVSRSQSYHTLSTRRTCHAHTSITRILPWGTRETTTLPTCALDMVACLYALIRAFEHLQCRRTYCCKRCLRRLGYPAVVPAGTAHCTATKSMRGWAPCIDAVATHAKMPGR